MWNDIRAGVLAAKLQRFLLFAYNACNACFGPWNTHANFLVHHHNGSWRIFKSLAHDRGILVPVGEASVKDLLSR